MLVPFLNGTAQNTSHGKPNLFTDYPATINCTVAELSNLFSGTPGQNANVTFGNSFKSMGVVKTKGSKHNNLQTVAIRLPEFNDAVFALSKRTDENNKIGYGGRIINRNNGDGYELKKLDDDSYHLIKFKLENILPDCN